MQPTEESQRQLTVLVVEDHPEARESLAEFLRVCGFVVETAENGELAVAAAKAIHPDVIVMDLAMPVLDGWEATRRIKADWSTRDIPVIALSAYGTVEARQLALSVGCDDAMVKPVDPQLLHRRLRAYAAQKAGPPGSCTPSHH